MTEPLQSILDARDERALLKKQISLKGLPCVSLSLNVPGFPKSNPIVKTFFASCLRDLKYTLKAYQVDIIDKDAIETGDAAGDFFLIPFSPGALNLQAIKLICEDFEQNHPLGRFIDADVNDQQGNTVSSGKSKLCFFCLERPAIECRRENVHDAEELRSFMFPKMAGYNRQQQEAAVIKKLSSLAQQALLYEISLTPKPGLVDKFSNGSHADMNYQTFIDSSVAIFPWFGDLVREGYTFRNKDLSKALPLIRNIGLRMESAMYDATQNVNTQKGIIFLMGLSLFACGKLYSQSDRFNVDAFRNLIIGVCKDLVKRELADSSASGQSHGEEIFWNYGFSGARGEAESGFEMVFGFGLPQLAGVEKLNDEAIIRSFLAIASNNKDTNILYRRGTGVLTVFQNLCKNALENLNDKNYSAVIDFCKNENISPGGSADLLAVTIFVWMVINADKSFE
jgi:holo-ACP synthase/triphosphoribosyl-dephospho-CoA synthase